MQKSEPFKTTLSHYKAAGFCGTQISFGNAEWEFDFKSTRTGCEAAYLPTLLMSTCAQRYNYDTAAFCQPHGAASQTEAEQCCSTSTWPATRRALSAASLKLSSLELCAGAHRLVNNRVSRHSDTYPWQPFRNKNWLKRLVWPRPSDTWQRRP